MAKTEPFDLGLEVETYLNRLDNNLLLDTEESDQLFDHFHCEVEELTLLGLSEQEAFEVSKLRFGEQAVIQTEFKKVKPLKAVYKHLLTGLFLFFSLRLMISIVYLASVLNLLIADYWNISTSLAPYLDFAIRGILLILLAASVVLVLKKGKLNKYLLFAIPFISLICHVSLRFVHYQVLFQRKELYLRLMNQYAINSEIIMLISYLFLIGATFFLWRKNRSSLQFIN